MEGVMLCHVRSRTVTKLLDPHLQPCWTPQDVLKNFHWINSFPGLFTSQGAVKNDVAPKAQEKLMFLRFAFQKLSTTGLFQIPGST